MVPISSEDSKALVPTTPTELYLKRINDDLLSQIATLRKELADKEFHHTMLSQLREANQYLVIATVDAQDMQANAEAYNKRQEEFLSMLAHELRNPLAPIALAADLIGKLVSSHPDLPELQAIIVRQINQMSRLIDDLLDASRLSSGKITLKRNVVSLSCILQLALESSQHLFDTRHQKLIFDRNMEDIPIDGDVARLAQVFSNILINGAKFTPEFGTVSITVEREGGFACVSIKDNGIGIPLDLQAHIFQLFKQGFHSLNRSQGGLGIGLSLARVIVEMHKGSILVHSDGTGFGSEFIVRLPISGKATFPVVTVAAPKINRKFCQILLIEDNADTNFTLEKLLKQEGHSVSSCSDGMGGLLLAMKNSYDVIICDIGLPDMDGFEIVKKLRAETSLTIPTLIALTGYNQFGMQQRAKEIGFDYYLVKPVNVPVLLDIVSSITLYRK